MDTQRFNGTSYTLSGPEGKPLVALIHGVGLNRKVWQWLEPDLRNDFRVLTYDLIGHGETDPPQGQPSLGDLSRQLLELLDHLNKPKVAIVGFSLGGMIARRFAQDYPERLAALCILNSPHRRTPAARSAVLSRVAQTEIDGPRGTVEAALARWFTTAFSRENPKVVNLVRDWVLANDPKVYPKIYRLLVDGLDEILAPAPPISSPTLVLTADEDFGNSPEMGQAIADEISGARLNVLTGLRHMALAEAPDQVNQPVVSFLKETYS